jgi:uncharacterized protein (TIGR02284 family)
MVFNPTNFLKLIKIMKADSKVIAVLNDLVHVNQDRTKCYEKAADEIRDPFEAEFKTLFFQMADESRRYSDVLSSAVKSLGGHELSDGIAPGEIYEAWMDMRVSFSGNDVLTSLQSCECSDDAVLKAYKLAINGKGNWPTAVADLVVNQFKSLKASHDMVKRYRDDFVEKVKFA